MKDSLWFDYDLQVWVHDGEVMVCGHPLEMSSPAKPCCNASTHAYGGSSIEQARRDFFGVSETQLTNEEQG
jgi:hypothetical protein